MKKWMLLTAAFALALQGSVWACGLGDEDGGHSHSDKAKAEKMLDEGDKA